MWSILLSKNTVDGWNPAPVDMDKISRIIYRVSYMATGARIPSINHMSISRWWFFTYVARIKHCENAFCACIYITLCKQLDLTLLRDLPTSHRFWIDNIMIPIIPAIQLVVSWGAISSRRESAVRDLLLREFKLTPIIRMNDKEVKDKPRSNETGSKSQKRSWNRCEKGNEASKQRGIF